MPSPEDSGAAIRLSKCPQGASAVAILGETELLGGGTRALGRWVWVGGNAGNDVGDGVRIWSFAYRAPLKAFGSGLGMGTFGSSRHRISFRKTGMADWWTKLAKRIHGGQAGRVGEAEQSRPKGLGLGPF